MTSALLPGVRGSFIRSTAVALLMPSVALSLQLDHQPPLLTM